MSYRRGALPHFFRNTAVACLLLLGLCRQVPAQAPELVPQISGGDEGGGESVQFGASGSWLASAEQGFVVLYDVKGGHISRRIATGGGQAQIAAHPSRDLLAIQHGSTLEAYDVNKGSDVWSINLKQPCNAIHFADHGAKLLGVCDVDSGATANRYQVAAQRAYSVGALRAWNVATGAEEPSPALPKGFGAGVVFSEDGRWVVGGKVGPQMPGANQAQPGFLKSLKNQMAMIHAMKEHVVLDTATGQIISQFEGYSCFALSAAAHTAMVMEIGHFGIAKAAEFALVDVLSGQRKQGLSAMNGGMPQVSADGLHFVLADFSGVQVLDAVTGQIARPMFPDLPVFTGVSLAPDGDQIAFSQTDSVILGRLSVPGQSQKLGRASALVLTRQAIQAPPTPPVAPPPPEKSHPWQAVVQPERNTNRSSQKRISRIEAEQRNQQAQWGNYGEAFKKQMMTFGGPVYVPPISAFLDAGRLLVVLQADYSWGLWDVATGNRLPYSKPIDMGYYTSYVNGKRLFDMVPEDSDLLAIEQSFGVTSPRARPTATAPDAVGTVRINTPDGKQYFTAHMPEPDEHASGIQVWDTASQRVEFDLPDALGYPSLLSVAPGGKVLVGVGGTSTLCIWDRHTGERLGTLYALQEGEWLLTTPSGLFDGSPRGWGEIAWRDPGSNITLPSEVFFNEFYRPGLLAELLDGRPPAPPRTIAQVDRRQPTVALAADSTSTSQRSARIHLKLAEALEPAGGVRDVRLFRNGVLVKAWRGDLDLSGGHAALDITVPLIAGENHLVAYAFNHDDVKSPDAEMTILCTEPAVAPTAYIVTVGVNQYSNAAFNLNYAAPDASYFSQVLSRSLHGLGTYQKVVQVNLLDADATKANVLLALDILGGKAAPVLPPASAEQLGALHAARPEDSVVLYFAGHGLAWRDRFYLIPHDLGYAGSRNELRSSLDLVLQNSLSDVELERAFEPVDAAHILLIVDACNSGKALDAQESRRGPMNSKGLAQLAYEKGMYVLTASQSFQAALESAQLGHGYLTYALTDEALATSIADTSPADGETSVTEWFEYAARRVPQMQSEALNSTSSSGRLLTFESAADPITPATSRLQTPRLYYRRDASQAQVIVSKSSPKN